MSYFKEVRCIRCGHPLGDAPYYRGCPDCLQEGYHVNYTTVYDVRGAKLPPKDNGQPGMYRFRDFLPIHSDVAPASLGEGDTPLIPLPRLGKELGLKNLWAKDESRNPSLSFKDRLCSVAATMARQQNAKALTISSTGNHGAAISAYAASVGIPCIAFTVPYVPATMKTLMQVYGAYLVVCPTGEDRWTIMGQCVEELGWMPVSGFSSPPVGSPCYGVDGYKTIAFEVYEQLGGRVPDYFAAPVAYCDGIYGIYKGMCDLRDMGYIDSLPKMVGGEVSGSLGLTLQRDDLKPTVGERRETAAFSVGTEITTYQGVEAVSKSEGYARQCSEAEILDMQRRLASQEGIYAENASVLPLIALGKLAKEGVIKPEDKVVALITSTGLKDTETTTKYLPAPPTVPPDMEALRRALKDAYDFSI